MPSAYPFQGFVLVAVPNRFSEVTRRFGEELGLSPEAQRAYEVRLRASPIGGSKTLRAIICWLKPAGLRSSCMRAMTPTSRSRTQRRSLPAQSRTASL